MIQDEYSKNDVKRDCKFSLRRPRSALLDEKHWLYIQRRYYMSPRELEVAKLVCQGLNNKEISKDLEIRSGTVKTHIRNIYRRIHVDSKIAMLLKFVDDARRLSGRPDTGIPIVEIKK